MQSLSSSASRFPYLVNINTGHGIQPGSWRVWKQVLARGLVHWGSPQQLRRQPAVNGIRSRTRPIIFYDISTMPKETRASSSAASAKVKTPLEPRPSSSIILVSPDNQVLLLHRVKTSTSFASAHVFPGGNLSDFHDGIIPPPGDASRHEDSLAYRLGAIRETFEESGILLARQGNKKGPLLNLPTAERDEARKAIYENAISFEKWLESVGGVADTGKQAKLVYFFSRRAELINYIIPDGLLPFTRWITPPHGPPKRFTTQMYVYLLPLETSADPVLSAAQSEALIPTADGGAEITAAHFDDAATWLAKQGRGDIILFPPQYFLLHLLGQFLTGAPAAELGSSEKTEYYAAQREKLREFLHAVPTSAHPGAADHPTSRIPWAEKVISPVTLGLRNADRRSILALDKPGAELKGSGRGGDWERVVLVKFDKSGPSNVEVRGREEVLAGEREARAKEEASSKL
ncbi:hypothetical protein F4678DRAFT_475895 [Xylaria arbuscula]|nr:hypothetical protein F4678DRAFT_475895 [Xylaria arbuscula]